MKKIALTTGLRYNWHVLDVLKAFRRAGVRYVELWGHPNHADLTDSRLVRRLGELQRNSSLQFVAVHPPARDGWAIDTFNARRREKTYDCLRQLIDGALRLGIRKLVLHPGGRRPDSETETQMALAVVADLVDRLLAFLEDRPLQLCLENTLPHHLGGHLSELKWLDQNTEGEFKLTLDTSHASLGKTPIMDYVSEFGSRIRHTHLSDNHGSYDDHLPPGEGQLDFPRILRKLLQKGRVDCWLLEVLKMPGAQELAESCEKTLVDFEQLLEESTSRPAKTKI